MQRHGDRHNIINLRKFTRRISLEASRRGAETRRTARYFLNARSPLCFFPYFYNEKKLEAMSDL
jgi:hypothetical protein